MKEKVITDNASEKITVKWDGERFALIKTVKWTDEPFTSTFILNPREMLDLIDFAGKLGGK